MSRVKQGSAEPGESAAQKEKAGESPRSPNAVLYRNNYSTNYRIVKCYFQEIWPGRTRYALAVDTGEPEWSAYSGALGRTFLSPSPKGCGSGRGALPDGGSATRHALSKGLNASVSYRFNGLSRRELPVNV
jgi:hypothetical protein